MAILRSSLSTARILIIKKLRSPRAIICAALLVCLYIVANDSFFQYHAQNGMKLTPFSYVAIANASFNQMLFMIIWCFFVCDIPSPSASVRYMLPRCGHLGWFFGNLISVAVLSAIFVLFQALISALIMLPITSFNTEWGFGWLRISMGIGMDSISAQLGFSSAMVSSMTAIAALAQTLLLQWLCGIYIALIVYFGNALICRPIGALIAAAITVMDITVFNELPNAYYALSPLSLTSLTARAGEAAKINPNAALAVSFAIMLAASLLMTFVHSRWLSVKPEGEEL